MNIVFMGTPDFAEYALKSLCDNGYNVVAVVTNPDRPQGRNMKLVYSPVKEYALSQNIKVFQTEKIKKDTELINELKNINPDVFVVAAFGQILSKEILDIPRLGSINIHGSLLPKYRGAAPIQWSVINGDKVTGITTMYMDVGMDTGDMIEKYEVVIDDDDTYGSLYEKMKIAGGKLILSTLDKIEKGNADRIKQSDDFSYAPMIEKEMGHIDFNNSADSVRNLVRGFNPVPGAFMNLDGQIIKIWNVKVLTSKSDTSGVVLCANSKDGLIVSTGDYDLEIIELQMPNSKKMLAKDYLNGHTINVGCKIN